MRLLISQHLISFHLLTVLLFSSSLSPSSSSCAWAAEDGTRSSLHLRLPRNVIRGGARALDNDPVLIRKERRFGDAAEQQQHVPRSPVATQIAAEPAHVVRDCQPSITPPPSLLKRQDQGQINALSGEIQRISESFRSVSQASQQVSQSSQQLSQSLQQASQRLSQTEVSLASARGRADSAEQASRSATQAANDASRRADEAQASASREVSQAFSEASRSANEMMAGLSSSMAASAASALAQASESASIIANSAMSRIQQAQADATAVRNDAQTQVQQAQGAAVSVTQAALAVVGGIVVSSLLTIVAFVLIMRYKRRKKAKQLPRFAGKDSIGYPALKATSSSAGDYKIGDYDESNYDGSPPPSRGYSVAQYPSDVKEPLAVLDRKNATFGGLRNSTSVRKPGVGVGMSGPGAAAFKLKDPPRGKFSLFPSPSSSSPVGGSPNMRGSKSMFPSLDTWLRNGTNVSPFGTVNKGIGVATSTEGKATPEWPMRRS